MMRTFMVKVKSLKKHKFIKILELSWDFTGGYSHNNTLITTMTQLKIRCIMKHQFNDIDEMIFETGWKGFRILRSSPHFHVPIGVDTVPFGYVNGVKVVFSHSEEAKICLKYRDKIIGEIKILNYE